MGRDKAEPDVEPAPEVASSRAPDGSYVGRASADGPETEEKSGAERRAEEAG